MRKLCNTKLSNWLHSFEKLEKKRKKKNRRFRTSLRVVFFKASTGTSLARAFFSVMEVLIVNWGHKFAVKVLLSISLPFSHTRSKTRHLRVFFLTCLAYLLTSKRTAAALTNIVSSRVQGRAQSTVFDLTKFYPV